MCLKKDVEEFIQRMKLHKLLNDIPLYNNDV